ncbi:glycosyltransferase family 39 protein [Candidatus Poribacteria bacterium]|nr:glycosyltransferase family 39 protein [Candidatus Poribacteria bacterium]
MKYPRFANAVAFPLVILIALAMRLLFYTGPIGSDDHDYYLGAYEVYKGTYHPSDNYWKNRFGMLLPIAASYELFGTNEFAAAVWPMACSLAAVVVCYALGKFLVDKRTGLLGALLLAFYPLDIHYSGMILPDIPLSFLMAASALAFLRACQSEKYGPILFFVSGLMLAIAYSCRSMAIIIGPFLLMYVAFFRKKMSLSYLLFAAGFLTIIFSEGIYYYLNGLSPLHNLRLNANAAIAVNSSGECSTSQSYYPQAVFQNLTVFGPYFFLFLPAMAFSLIKRERGALILLTWAGTILLILQFGFVSISPLIPLLKVRKFLIFTNVPLALLAAWALMKLSGRLRLSIVVAIIGVSIYLILPYNYWANGTPETSGANVRKVVAYLKQLPPKPVYADLRTAAMLMLVSGFEMKLDQFRDLYEVTSPQELKNCYVVINKFYARFDTANPYARVPYFVANYPMGVPAYWRAKDFELSAVLNVP